MSDQQVYRFLESGALGTEAPVILEVGCALFEDTKMLSNMYPKGRIFAFEPDPRNLYRIKGKDKNTNVTLIEAAIGDHDGEATFHLSDGVPPPNWGFDKKVMPTWTYSSSLKKPVEHLKEYPWCKFDKTAKVKVMKLDTFGDAHKIDKVDFLWADVQGAEDQMIAGGQKLLARTHFVFTEFSDRQLYEGQIGLDQILKSMPGGPDAWNVRAKLKYDVLLENKHFAAK
jgi:FkbM family methyltransferase